MSVMSTGRRPGAAVRRLSPEDAYLLLRRPGRAVSHPAAGRRPGRPRLRLVPPPQRASPAASAEPDGSQGKFSWPQSLEKSENAAIFGPTSLRRRRR